MGLLTTGFRISTSNPNSTQFPSPFCSLESTVLGLTIRLSMRQIAILLTLINRKGSFNINSEKMYTNALQLANIAVTSVTATLPRALV